jgi:DNA-binding response OmpR family regulator
MLKSTLRVLVIEDEVAIATMYQFKLSQQGYDVRCAFDGIDGLKQAEQFQPALILLDLRMPLMDGEEMLQKLRASEWGGTIRVAVLTNLSRNEVPANLQFLNVERYIVKAHHTPSQIVDIVSEIIGK